MRRALVTGLLVLMAAYTGTAAAATAPASKPPNIIFVLTDDLTSDLVQFMPNVQAMARRGMTFSNYSVSDSLCCPSRASIFTGRYPHNTRVFTNTPPNGGYDAFNAYGNQLHTFANVLYSNGYRTALVGKYLNGYPARYDGPPPPGWTDWFGSDSGYAGYDYAVNDNGVARHFGSAPQDYFTDVAGRRVQQIIADTFSKSDGRPLFLEFATFAPHSPATPAPQDVNANPYIQLPRGPAFGVANRNAPAWLKRLRPLRPQQIANFQNAYAQRTRAVLDVDRWIKRIRDQLRALGELDNTFFFFSSDNGYHIGEHRLRPGKSTAFDTDIRVPLIVDGPGVARGTTEDAVTQNIDLGPTFTAIAGARMPLADGASLLGFMQSKPPKRWRTAALVEHLKYPMFPGDPDFQPFTAGTPPTYDALRLARATYVQNHTGLLEYYDRKLDPNELVNRYGSLSGARKRQLAARVNRLSTCVGWRECRDG